MKRQIVLDTETTGLEPEEGHRIIEIGCVELVDRRLTSNNFHVYLQPDREIDQGAIDVHGITNEFLADKPRFEDISEEFLEYIKGAELIIHNAPFDVGFINHEFKRLSPCPGTVGDFSSVLDTLKMAREMHPGQRNSLDALCKRYDIDNSHRELHGALLDAQILSDVYLVMTGGQSSFSFDQKQSAGRKKSVISVDLSNRDEIKVIRANQDEEAEHEAYVRLLEEKSGKTLTWDH